MSLDSGSYMEMRLHSDKEKDKVLRIPTFWDDVEKQWIGAIQTPITNTLIYATGKNDFELQNNFNKVMSDKFKDEKIKDELFSMFIKE